MAQLKNEPKALMDISPEKIYKWQIKIWKYAPHSMSSEKYKLKWDITVHLLQCPKSRRLTAPKAGEIVELKELLFFAGGNEKSYCLFRSQFDSFILKLNILLTILSSSLAPLNQSRCPSVSRWVICDIYPDNGILFSCTSGKEPTCQCRRHKTRGFDP